MTGPEIANGLKKRVMVTLIKKNKCKRTHGEEQRWKGYRGIKGKLKI